MWTEHDFIEPEEPTLPADKWEHAQDHLIGLIEALYQKPNWAKLENHLQEVAGALEVDFELNDLKWEPIGSKQDNYLRGMKDADREHQQSSARAKLRTIRNDWSAQGQE